MYQQLYGYYVLTSNSKFIKSPWKYPCNFYLILNYIVVMDFLCYAGLSISFKAYRDFFVRDVGIVCSQLPPLSFIVVIMIASSSCGSR